MSLRMDFVTLAARPEANVRRLCRRFQISPETGYKWLRRFENEGIEGLADRSRRPHHSPRRSAPEIEEAVLKVRKKHSRWGGRTIRSRLLGLGWSENQLPAPSTITEILRRHGKLQNLKSSGKNSWQRFEAPAPNELWQMDFKGHFAMAQGRCHPLTVLDDHSRFSVGLEACGDETGLTVQARLTQAFRRYGLPVRMLMDNGSPWGSDIAHPFTPLTVWLIRLGITPVHSRPFHPQTLGKDERFHRTLKAEVLSGRVLSDLSHCQRLFDRWRYVYNYERPHQALEMQVPAQRYCESPRSFPEHLPPVDYGPNDIVRKVQVRGEVSFRGRTYQIPKAFRGYPVGLRRTTEDGVFDVFFCHHRVSRINLPNGKKQ